MSRLKQSLSWWCYAHNEVTPQHLVRAAAEIGTAKLWYDKPHKRYFLLVSFEVERPDPTPEQHTQVIGVDVGVRYLAVTSDSKGNPPFILASRSEIEPITTPGCANVCKKKALVPRHVA